MPLLREQNIKYIIEKLALLQYIVRLSNKQQLYDSAKELEDFCMGLLNKINDWNLKNLNNENPNNPIIDLSDEVNKVAIQVTSDKSGNKVKETVTAFVEKQLQNTYSRLIILILVQKQDRYSLMLPQTFNFSQKNDIWDYSDLISKIKGLPPEKIIDIKNYIEIEFPTSECKIDYEKLDRFKKIINQIQNGHEDEIKLEIEILCSQKTKEEYFELIELLNRQVECRDFLEEYVNILLSILSEESWKKDEFEILMAESEQYDNYEQLYEFCDEYSIIVSLPYDANITKCISYRVEHKALIERENEIIKKRKELVELIKQEMK
jgi:hypothetical protein